LPSLPGQTIQTLPKGRRHLAQAPVEGLPQGPPQQRQGRTKRGGHVGKEAAFRPLEGGNLLVELLGPAPGPVLPVARAVEQRRDAGQHNRRKAHADQMPGLHQSRTGGGRARKAVLAEGVEDGRQDAAEEKRLPGPVRDDGHGQQVHEHEVLDAQEAPVGVVHERDACHRNCRPRNHGSPSRQPTLGPTEGHQPAAHAHDQSLVPEDEHVRGHRRRVPPRDRPPQQARIHGHQHQDPDNAHAPAPLQARAREPSERRPKRGLVFQRPGSEKDRPREIENGGGHGTRPDRCGEGEATGF